MQRKIITVILILLALLLCFADSFAQTFLGIGATNKGIPISIGTLVQKVEIKGTFIRPYKYEKQVAAITLGYQVNITDYEKDNYSITPSIGYANVRWKDFKAYYADPTGKTGIVQLNEYRVAYGLELGKDLFLGRFYISGNYYNAFYLGIGIKAYFRYNQLQKLKY